MTVSCIVPGPGPSAATSTRDGTRWWSRRGPTGSAAGADLPHRCTGEYDRSVAIGSDVRISRRQLLQAAGAGGAALLIPGGALARPPARPGRPRPGRPAG